MKLFADLGSLLRLESSLWLAIPNTIVTMARYIEANGTTANLEHMSDFLKEELKSEPLVETMEKFVHRHYSLSKASEPMEVSG